MQQNVPGVAYNENYQQQFDPSYGRGYAVPAPYQQPQQPNLFVPSPAPQVPQVLQVTLHAIILTKKLHAIRGVSYSSWLFALNIRVSDENRVINHHFNFSFWPKITLNVWKSAM